LEGKKVTPAEQPRKLAPVVDLMDALKQSLSKMEGKKKPAKREGANGNKKLHQKRSA
jgi:non-homologous end joining protein Ku